ncbi:MAG: DUF721 domain-containing protein [Desulfobulbaceae bacterium]|nr:MAG: DUF721 domain-containing protein [Desulfobulbaceae bacterium]
MMAKKSGPNQGAGRGNREMNEFFAKAGTGGLGEEPACRPGRQARFADPVGGLLGRLAVAKKWRWRLAQHTVFIAWPKLVGREIAAVARPEVIRDAVLWVRVVDPVWSQQLQFATTTLLDKINQGVPEEAWISAIRFRLDPSLDHEIKQEAASFGELIAESSRLVDQPTGPSTGMLISSAEEGQFSRLIASVADAEARANLLRLWRKSHRSP